MAVTKKALRNGVFALVEEYKLVWHGLYQGRTNVGGHTDPANGYSPTAYGAADWNVRLIDVKAKPPIHGYGGGESVADAVCQAIAQIERERAARKVAVESVVVDYKMLRRMGVYS